jgi:DNA-binding transcriptional ArsR family regulator
MTEREAAHAVPSDPDDVFSAISNSRRRQVLLSLAQSDCTLAAGDLAVEIAAIECLVEPSKVTSKQRTRIYVPLTQSHLPKLAEAGLIEYDERGKKVSPTAATKPVANHIRRLETSCYTPEDEDEQ